MRIILCDDDDDKVPGGDGDSPQVEVVSDGVLEVVVHPALGEPRVQVLPQVGRDRTCKRIYHYKQLNNSFVHCYVN